MWSVEARQRWHEKNPKATSGAETRAWAGVKTRSCAEFLDGCIVHPHIQICTVIILGLASIEKTWTKQMASSLRQALSRAATVLSNRHGGAVQALLPESLKQFVGISQTIGHCTSGVVF